MIRQWVYGWMALGLGLVPGVRADWGIYDAGVFLNNNGGGSTYVNVGDFDGSFLGDFYSFLGNSLVLAGGEAKVWKNVPGSDVTSVTFHYQVYPIDQGPGAYTALSLPFSSDDPGAPSGSQNQTWKTETAGVNLLAGLTRPGTYRLRVYISATGTNPSDPKFFSNNGADYIATFNYNIPELTVNGVNANYTTTKFFVDEVAGDTFPLNVVFRPNAPGPLTDVEVFHNVNRRDKATQLWTNGATVLEEGIFPRPGNSVTKAMTNAYFIAQPMTTNVPGQEYSLTIPVSRTGAYRLTARYRYQGNTNWFWYTDTGQGRRDHAVVVSPDLSRDIVMYELNTLNIKATGTLESQRSTFVDLWDGPGSDPTKPGWNLGYAKALGVNWLWFQPVHPYGVDGRHLSAADIDARAGVTTPGDGADTWIWNGGAPYYDEAYPYALGSPYAVKNFWDIEPRMSKANTREAAMQEFTNFVEAADGEGVSIMLDAAFNHTAWDVELGDLGVDLFSPASTSDTEIRNVEARFFSKLDAYDQRATSAGDIAPAPDRYDFGKWLDVKDVHFGRYAALVPDGGDSGRYQDEGDWFDYTQFDAITRNVWRYFGAYVPYWLEKTGHPAGTPPEDHHLGIDGLRCDFGQGLPPQAWEYIINRARAIKWSFVFMAETLDGGAPPYRSNRHFDVLNENIIFALQGAGDATAYRSILESRRGSFGQGLVLLNTVSHDEKNYVDPWEAVIRYGAVSTVDGNPMLFAGQELGLSEKFGYDLMEINFGKHIPHFKTWNSMMPLWNDTDFGNDQLFPVYAAINRARNQSPALRSSNRYFLNPVGWSGPYEAIFSVAKYEVPNGSPATTDVVFAFMNLDRDSQHGTTYDVDIDANGSNLFGIKPGRTYNVRNLAAHTGILPGRNEAWLWGGGLPGGSILSNGIYVLVNPVPTNVPLWTFEPFEAQYLKLYDVTTPAAPAAAPVPQNVVEGMYVLSNQVTFAWAPVADPEGLVPGYWVIADINGSLTTQYVTGASVTLDVDDGDVVSIRVRAANPNQTANASAESPVSAAVRVLEPGGDFDLDGVPSADELVAGTDPADLGSVFTLVGQEAVADPLPHRVTVATEPGRVYRIQFADGIEPPVTWMDFGNTNLGFGRWVETNAAASQFTFTDDGTTNTTFAPPADGRRFYRVWVESP